MVSVGHGGTVDRYMRVGYYTAIATQSYLTAMIKFGNPNEQDWKIISYSLQLAYKELDAQLKKTAPNS